MKECWQNRKSYRPGPLYVPCEADIGHAFLPREFCSNPEGVPLYMSGLNRTTTGKMGGPRMTDGEYVRRIRELEWLTGYIGGDQMHAPVSVLRSLRAIA
jgi:hypothetical protein